MRHRTLSERALVLAPHGRDAAIAASVLSEADVGPHICPNLQQLVEQLNNGAGLVVVTEEALSGGRWLRSRNGSTGSGNGRTCPSSC